MNLLNCIKWRASLLHYRIKSGACIWPSIYAVCMPTSGEYDDILVAVWLLVIFAKLHLLDGSGTFSSIINIPVIDFWPFVPAVGNSEVHRSFKAWRSA